MQAMSFEEGKAMTIRIGDTVERRLKDYKGYAVWKITDNKGTRHEEITYMLQDDEDNNINCFLSLQDLKRWTDEYTQ